MSDFSSQDDLRVHLRGPSETFEMSKSQSISVSPNREEPSNLIFDSNKLDEISQIFELHASGHSGHFLTKDDFVKCMETIVPSMSIQDMETIFDEYDKEQKGIIHWKPIIEELRHIKVDSGSNADASLMDFFAGKLTDDFCSFDISAMAQQMGSEPMVQALFAWYRDEGEPAIERVSELEQILATEHGERAKVEKELRLQLEQAVKKQELTMRHCAALEKDLERQTEQFKQELQHQKDKSKNMEQSTDKMDRNRRNRYTRIIQEKDKELKKVQVDYLDLTKEHNVLREELETITSEKIDAETATRLAEDRHSLMERQIEQMKEHSKNQLAASKEREQKLREQIKDLSEYYTRRPSMFNHDSQDMDHNFVIKISNETQNSHQNNLKRQIRQSESIDSLTGPGRSITRSMKILPYVSPSLSSIGTHISGIVEEQSPRRAMSVQIENQKLPKLDVKNPSHWELAKQRRRSHANLLSLQHAYSHTLQNLRDQTSARQSASASPDPGLRITEESSQIITEYKQKLANSEEEISTLKDRLRSNKREKESWEKQYNALEQQFKENLGTMARGKEDSRIKRVMEAIYSDLNRRQDETILETLQTFQRELQSRNNELTKLQQENAQLRGSQASDSTSFNVKLWSDQIKEMQEKLIYAESQNIKASTDYRILVEEKQNLQNQLRESHFQNDLLQKQLVETKTRQPVYNSSLIPSFHHSHNFREREHRQSDELAPPSAGVYMERGTIPDELLSKRTPERQKKKPRIRPRAGWFYRDISWTDLEENFQHKYSTPLTPFDEPPPPPILDA